MHGREQGYGDEQNTGMTEQREQRGVFGEAAGQYAAARPDYPPELVADVLAYAGSGPALEVGAGTGKASVAFAAHGLDLTCLEPDPRMAAVLTRNCQPYPRVSVVVDRFESWRPDRRYQLLLSAQAWHWVDPGRRTDLAYAALAPGGAIALFWNIFAAVDPAVHHALVAVDARHGLPPGEAPHAHHVDEYADDVMRRGQEEREGLRLRGDGRFTELVTRWYRRNITYQTAGYLDLLSSISWYRLLEPGRRDAVLAEVVEVVDGHGGSITLDAVTDLTLARRESETVHA